jgi:Predicted ribosomal protein
MIKAAFYTRNGRYIGFSVSGHAGFDEEGHDILCAAVSALTINAVNSLEKLTNDTIITEECDDGKINCKVAGHLSPESELIIKSLRLGLCDIYKDNDVDDNIKVFFREVN